MLGTGCRKDEPVRDRNTVDPEETAAPRATKAAADPSGEQKLAGLIYFEAVRGVAKADEPLPLVVALHGMGDRPDTTVFPDFGFPVRVVWPQAPTPHLKGFQWFPFESLENAPHHLAYDIEAAADKVMEFILAYTRQRKIQGKPVVAGFSQGGMIALVLAIKYPKHIGAAHPIAAALPKALWPETAWNEDDRSPHAPLKNLPVIRSLHGVADDLMPVSRAKDLNSALKKAKYDAEIRTFEGVGHVLSAQMDEILGVQLVESVRACAQK